MITADLARSLALAGLRWHPVPGDRFTIEAEDLDQVVYTVSELIVEVHEYPTGTILGFNGTTEWALDSVDMDQTLWLPSEEQLRTLLGATFRSLVRADAPADPGASSTLEPEGSTEPRSAGTYVVAITLHGETVEFRAEVAAEAYGQALLSLITASTAIDA
jgi:hypothetical protein